MSQFFEHLKKDWEAFKEEGQKLDATVDQAYDYTNTSSPDEIEIESFTATPKAEKAVKEAMQSYLKQNPDHDSEK